MSIKEDRRIVFFDLDGTLHQQDMLGSFLRFLLWKMPQNLLLVVPMLPIIVAGLILAGRATRWPMSLLLWSITFGHSEKHLKALESDFVVRFRQKVVGFPVVQKRLRDYLAAGDADIWLITGSPEHLVQQVYHSSPFLAQVNLIGSRINRKRGGWVLSLRCLGEEKVVQLQQRLGAPLQLYSGYSDSKQDNPLLFFCEHRFRVSKSGELQQLE
ncbi:phosphatidylglycerophosphatase C [Rouxiella sp. Mn2063]|uniref:phosphatidylglycerophosphatase C n=1 Tax=Rouxiella sp. Mn2063 TaxID=3395262 RepID=UPI003BE77C25